MVQDAWSLDPSLEDPAQVQRSMERFWITGLERLKKSAQTRKKYLTGNYSVPYNNRQRNGCLYPR